MEGKCFDQSPTNYDQMRHQKLWNSNGLASCRHIRRVRVAISIARKIDLKKFENEDKFFRSSRSNEVLGCCKRW